MVNNLGFKYKAKTLRGMDFKQRPILLRTVLVENYAVENAFRRDAWVRLLKEVSLHVLKCKVYALKVVM